MIKKYINSLPVYLFENLLKYKNIQHFVSSRIGGVSQYPYNSLNLGLHVEDKAENVLENRKILASHLRTKLNNFTMAKQIHKNNVTIVTDKMRGKGSRDYQNAINATDALLTSKPNIYLNVLVADCVPILFFDPIKKVIGAVHTGWRGTVRLIAQKSIQRTQEFFSSEPSDIIVGIGPSIGPCCYEVGSDVISQVEKVFPSKEDYIINSPSNDKGYFDLWKANQAQLIQAGIPEENIEVAELCTCCNADMFFSVRHQKGETGRFAAGIMIL